MESSFSLLSLVFVCLFLSKVGATEQVYLNIREIS